MNYLEQLKQQQASYSDSFTAIDNEISSLRKEQGTCYYKIRDLDNAKTQIYNHPNDPAIQKIISEITDLKQHNQNLYDDFSNELDKKFTERRTLLENQDPNLMHNISYMETYHLTSDIVKLIQFLCRDSEVTFNGRKREKVFVVGQKTIKLSVGGDTTYSFRPTNFTGNTIINTKKDLSEIFFLKPSESSRKATKVFEWAIETRQSQNLETLLLFSVLDLDNNTKKEWTISDNDENAKVTMSTYDPKTYRFNILGKLPDTPRDQLKETIFNSIC